MDEGYEMEEELDLGHYVIESSNDSMTEYGKLDESLVMGMDEVAVVADQLRSEREKFFANQSDSLCTMISNNVSEIICFSNGSLVDLTNSSATQDSDEDPVPAPFGLFMTVLIATCIGICIVITVFGNLLVLTAFVVERTIRQPSNYFICSLAVSDLIIGLISMPFYAIYVLRGTWDLGAIPCDLWLSVDHTVCLVSIYTVLLITIDRYCSVKYPTRYRSWRNKRKVLWMVTLTWIIPFLIFFISIMGWEYFIGYRDLLPGECAVQFLKDPVFNTSLILFYFYFTLVVLFILYAGIYKIASDMAKRSEQKQRKVQSLVALGKTAAEMTARTLNQANLQADVEAAAREKRTSSHLDEGDEGRGVPAISQASKHKAATAETGFNHSVNLETIPSSGANSDQDRSSSPVFESDEEEEEDGVVAPVPIKPHISKKGKRGVRSDSVRRKRKKSRNSPFTCSHEDQKPVRALVPRSPVIASCPTRPPLTHEYTSSCPASQKSKGPLELPAHDMSPGTSAATTTTASGLEIQAEKKKAEQEEYLTLVSKRPQPPSTLDIEARRESGRKTRGTASSDSSSSHSSSRGRSGGKVRTEVDRSGSTRVVNKKQQDSQVDRIDPSAGRKDCRQESSGKKNVSAAGGDDVSIRCTGHNKPSLVIKLSRRFRGVTVTSKERRTKSKSENRARKALRTISFILGAFVLCWTPYHILALIQGFCSSENCVNHHLFYFTYFLCYANSPINPFCYAMANQQFKHSMDANQIPVKVLLQSGRKILLPVEFCSLSHS